MNYPSNESDTLSVTGIVDVVIPTTGRRVAELNRAISSVLAQVGTVLNRVFVVIDDPDSGYQLSTAFSAAPITTILNTTSLSARQLGVQYTEAPWIAFLDDDDCWMPGKLSAQLDLVADRTGTTPCIISSRITHKMEDSAVGPFPPIPASLIAPEQTISSYLFLDRSGRVNRSSMYTSTLLVSRAAMEQLVWRKIPRHQDWDFLLAAEQITGLQVSHHPEVLVRIQVGSPNSISRSTDWKASLEWSNKTLRAIVDSKTYANFIASQPLRYAIAGRSITGIKACTHALVNNRVFPSFRTICFASAGLLPTTLLKSIMQWRS